MTFRLITVWLQVRVLPDPPPLGQVDRFWGYIRGYKRRTRSIAAPFSDRTSDEITKARRDRGLQATDTPPFTWSAQRTLAPRDHTGTTLTSGSQPEPSAARGGFDRTRDYHYSDRPRSTATPR